MKELLQTYNEFIDELKDLEHKVSESSTHSQFSKRIGQTINRLEKYKAQIIKEAGEYSRKTRKENPQW